MELLAGDTELQMQHGVLLRAQASGEIMLRGKFSNVRTDVCSGCRRRAWFWIPLFFFGIFEIDAELRGIKKHKSESSLSFLCQFPKKLAPASVS